MVVEVEREKVKNTKIKLPVPLHTRRNTFLFERESILPDLQVDHTGPCNAMRFIHLSLPTNFFPLSVSSLHKKEKRQLSVIIRNEHTARHIGAVR